MKTSFIIHMFLICFLNQNLYAASSSILNDSWYSVSAAGAPWGYFYEKIEQQENGQYSYRYELTKKEDGIIKRENLGALSSEDLTPIAFNLNKMSGSKTTESFAGTYQKNLGSFSIKHTQTIGRQFSRTVPKETILDAFFPVWVSKLGDGWKSHSLRQVNLFAETVQGSDYSSRIAIVSPENEKSTPFGPCREYKVNFDTKNSIWCVTKKGGLLEMTILDVKLKPFVMVKKVANEAQAKSFLKP